MTTTTHPYAVGWGTLALINAALAQQRGRSALAWFAISLLFGPLATLGLVLLGVEPPVSEPDEADWSIEVGTGTVIAVAACALGTIGVAFVLGPLVAIAFALVAATVLAVVAVRSSNDRT